VLFDLDGTLVDSIPLILTSFRFATEHVLGEALSDEVVLRDVGVPLATQVRSFSEEHADELLRVYRAHNAEHHDALIREYDGVEEVLRELKARGLAIGVVTSKLNRVARMGLDRFELSGLVDVLIGADDVEAHKPDPTPLLAAAQRLGVEPRRCAYVGDASVDMAAARAAGMISVAALWGPAEFRERVLAERPTYALETIRELPGLLGDISRPARLG
jgi:pyrophosphatase PpaX